VGVGGFNLYYVSDFTSASAVATFLFSRTTRAKCLAVFI
jgi:hypothetical protein